MANVYQKYQENTIYNMSPAELLLLLYDKAISDLTKAEYALEDKEYKIFENCLNHALQIIRYLIQILDWRYPLSVNLNSIYQYLILDISKIKAGRERQKDEIGRIRNILSELRDAFDQADKKLQAERKVKNHLV